MEMNQGSITKAIVGGFDFCVNIGIPRCIWESKIGYWFINSILKDRRSASMPSQFKNVLI